MISLVKKYVSSGLNDGAFPDTYSSETGKMTTFENRAVVGGHFALVRRLMSLGVLRTYTLFPLIFLSFSFPMSRRGTPTAVVAAVVIMVEVMVGETVEIMVAQQLLSALPCTWHLYCLLLLSVHYCEAQHSTMVMG